MKNRTELLQDGTYSAIPKAVLADRRLTTGAKIVYAALIGRLGNNLHVWPSIRTIARDCGMSKDGVGSAIQSLVTSGLINKHPNYKKKGSGYSFNAPPEYVVESELDGDLDSVSDIERPAERTLASCRADGQPVSGTSCGADISVLPSGQYRPAERTLASCGADGSVLPYRTEQLKEQPKGTTEGEQQQEPHHSAATRQTEREGADLAVGNRGDTQTTEQNETQTLLTAWIPLNGNPNLTASKTTLYDAILRKQQKKVGLLIDPSKVSQAAHEYDISFQQLVQPSGTTFVWHRLQTNQPIVPAEVPSSVIQQISRAKKTLDKKKNPWPEDQVLSIYNAYPRKVGRGVALPAIQKALTVIKDSGEHEDPVTWLLDRAKAYATSRVGQDPKFTPHPATWFNQMRYLDAVESTTSDRTSRLVDDSDTYVPIINEMPEL